MDEKKNFTELPKAESESVESSKKKSLNTTPSLNPDVDLVNRMQP